MERSASPLPCEDKRVPDEQRVKRRLKQTSPSQEIADLVVEACGSPPRVVQRIVSGYSTEVHEVWTHDDQHVVYKAKWEVEGRGFERERWALEQCEQHGIQAPRILAITPNKDGRSACVLRFIEGETLEQVVDAGGVSEGGFRELLLQVGELYARLHSIHPSGYGIIDNDGRGQARDWRSHYGGQVDVERLTLAARNARVDWGLVATAIERLESAQLDVPLTPALCHKDFKLAHIVIRDGKVVALLDFEHCEGSDPASELPWCDEHLVDMWDGLTEHSAEPVPIQPILAGYQRVTAVEDMVSRARWHQLRGHLLGLSWHGVHDVDTPDLMSHIGLWFETGVGRLLRRG